MACAHLIDDFAPRAFQIKFRSGHGGHDVFDSDRVEVE